MPNGNAFNQLVGLVLLFVVKLASVVSAEISRHLFHDLEFKRPFLVTYVKYCMFSMFLIRYATSDSSKSRMSMSGKANYAKLENTASDEEYEVESLTPAEFELLTSDVESEKLESASTAVIIEPQSPGGNCVGRPQDGGGGVVVPENASLIEIRVDDNGNNEDNQRRPLLDRQPLDEKGIRRVRFALMREVRAFPARIQRDAKLARLSYRPKIAYWTCRCRQFTRSASLLFATTNDETFSCFFFLAPLCFLSALTFQIALVFASVTATNLIALSYAAFLVLIGLTCGRRVVSTSTERFTLLKLGVLLTNIGCVLLLVHRGVGTSLGAFVALTSALAHAGYLAAFACVSAKYVTRLEMSYVFGTFGLFTLTVCTPLLVVLHAYSYESQTPTPTMHQWTLIVANGAIGGVIAEALWLRATTLVSTNIALLSTTLSVLLSAAADLLVRGESPTLVETFASVPITALFVGTSLLAVPALNSTTTNGRQPPTAGKSSITDVSADGRFRSNYNQWRRDGPSLDMPSFCGRCFGIWMVDLEDAMDADDDSPSGIHASHTSGSGQDEDGAAGSSGWLSSYSSSAANRDPMRVMMSDAMESIRLMDAVNEE